MAMVAGLLVLGACSNQRTDPAVLQHKIDSVMALDNAERLRLQGIRLEEDNMVKVYYDSLNLQPLPVVCSAEYATTLSRFVSVPDYLAGYWEIPGGNEALAIALPESLGARLVMLAIDSGRGSYSLWLYSLDDDYLPVDKLQIYTPPSPVLEVEGMQMADCIISRDYEITIREIAPSSRKIVQHVYHVSDGRTFLKQ